MSGFCTLCGTRIESFEGLSACPKCGATSVPCSDEDQVTVSVNVHELRILCIWAENHGHAIKTPDVVYAIAARLRRQLPKDTALTMADEFSELKKAFPTFETNHPAADNPETGANYNPQPEGPA